MRELLAHRLRLVRSRTAVINELHAVYAKRNIEVPGMIWHRIRPMPWWAEELSGYAPRIVSENTELLKVINHQIQELGKVGQEDSPDQKADDDCGGRSDHSCGGQ